MAIQTQLGPTGAAVRTNLGQNTVVGANAGVQPLKGQVNIGVSAAQRLGGSGNSASVSAGLDPAKGTVGVSPKIQIGESGEAQVGGAAGSLAGQAVAGPIGGAVGSAAGSATGQAIHNDATAAGVGLVAGGVTGATIAPTAASVGQSAISAATKPFSSGSNKGHQNRNKLRSEFQKTGVYGKDGTVPLPDGSTANFNLDAHEGLHDFKYGDKRQDKAGDRQLFAYETDYTNDLDYVASMGGISLSRLLAGGKDKATDQHGQLIGNQSLGKAGFGSEFSEENFNAVTGNLKAVYANAGIKTKEEMLSLANKAYSEGRINEADFAVQQQTAGIIFDNDYGLASKLMQGRWGGIKAAGETPAGSTQMATGGTRADGGVYSPGVAGPEAMSSFQHYIQVYNQGIALAQGNNPSPKKGLSAMSYLAIAAGLYGAVGSGTKAVKKGDKKTPEGTKGGTGLAGIIGGAVKYGAHQLSGLYDDIFGETKPSYADTITSVGSDAISGMNEISDTFGLDSTDTSNGFDFSI